MDGFQPVSPFQPLQSQQDGSPGQAADMMSSFGSFTSDSMCWEAASSPQQGGETFPIASGPQTYFDPCVTPVHSLAPDSATSSMDTSQSTTSTGCVTDLHSALHCNVRPICMHNYLCSCAYLAVPCPSSLYDVKRLIPSESQTLFPSESQRLPEQHHFVGLPPVPKHFAFIDTDWQKSELQGEHGRGLEKRSNHGGNHSRPL